MARVDYEALCKYVSTAIPGGPPGSSEGEIG
jgi:hypothetical protein